MTNIEDPSLAQIGAQAAATNRAPRAEAMLQQAIELVENARPMPLSASSMIKSMGR